MYYTTIDYLKCINLTLHRFLGWDHIDPQGIMHSFRVGTTRVHYESLIVNCTAQYTLFLLVPDFRDPRLNNSTTTRLMILVNKAVRVA
jgi:hypothetical protein